MLNHPLRIENAANRTVIYINSLADSELPVNHEGTTPTTADVTKQQELQAENERLIKKMAAAEQEADALRRELAQMAEDQRIEADQRAAQEQRTKIVELEHEIREYFAIFLVKNGWLVAVLGLCARKHYIDTLQSYQ